VNVTRDATMPNVDDDPTEAVDAGLEALRAARAGDHEAARRLVARHGPSMLRTAWRVLGRYGRADAEDVVQEALVAALTTPALPDGDVGAWLRAISARKALDSLRRSGRRAETTLADVAEPVVGGEPADVLAAREALAALSAEDRAVLTLVDLEGYSSAEAARVLGRTHVAVRLRVSRARRKLRRILGNAGGGDTE
jgi:RNA polymerase sigma-70 factor (ECF subfamily)